MCFQNALALADSARVDDSRLCYAMWVYGHALQQLGRYREAIEVWEAASSRTMCGTAWDTIGYSSLLSAAGALYIGLGQYARAESLLTHAAGLLHGQDSVTRAEYVEVAQILGVLYSNWGMLDKAEVVYRDLLGILRTRRLHNTPRYGSLLLNLGTLYLRRGLHEDADSLYRMSWKIQSVAHDGDHLDKAIALNDLAEVRKLQKRFDEADSLLILSAEMTLRLVGTEHPDYAWVLVSQSQLYADWGRLDVAESTATLALVSISELKESNPDIIAMAIDALAEARLARRDYGSAESLFTESLTSRRALLPTDHPNLLMSFGNLARVHLAQNRTSSARSFLLSGLHAFDETATYPTQSTDSLVSEFAKGLRKVGKPETAQRMESTGLPN